MIKLSEEMMMQFKVSCIIGALFGLLFGVSFGVKICVLLLVIKEVCEWYHEFKNTGEVSVSRMLGSCYYLIIGFVGIALVSIILFALGR